jgi:hypothetical protein
MNVVDYKQARFFGGPLDGEIIPVENWVDQYRVIIPMTINPILSKDTAPKKGRYSSEHIYLESPQQKCDFYLQE